MKWVRNVALSVTFLLLLSTTLSAQIAAQTTIPSEADPYTCVVVSVQSPAKFANLKVLGKSNFAPVQTYALKDVKGEDGVLTRLWTWTGPPDEYLVWIDLFDPQLGISTEVGKTIIGVPVPPEPPKPPDPKPKPSSGKYDVVMFYNEAQLRDMPKEQNAVLHSLKLREDIEKSGHTVLEVLEDDVFTEGLDIQFKPFAEAVKGQQLPLVVVRDKDTGEVKWKPLPKNPVDMLLLLENWQ